MSREPFTLALALHRDDERDAAILVSLDGDETKAVWLPRSKVTFVERAGRTVRGPLGHCLEIEATMPEWLAIDRGLA